ncbi:unnamed protein product [Pedinophyceae sp. YPF-701]|nr:unnamed protein product [Pedinophyceae sp. YPF-701]
MSSTIASGIAAPARASTVATNKRAISSVQALGGARLAPRPAARAAPLQSRSSVVVEARASKGAQVQKTVEVDKPLGLNLAQGKNGLTVKSSSGNAAKAGIEKGDTVIYASSYFGDELWPADKLGFTRSAIQACPSPVAFVITKGENTSVDVKRLPKKAAPKRFGRKLTASQKELATHICIDCGYIYCDKTPFDELDLDYRCPQCLAPKRRFAGFDPETGKKDTSAQLFAQVGTVATVVVGLGAIAVLFWLASSV